MPAFTLELTYRLPVYQHVTIEADTIEEACRIAIDTDDWERATKDYDSSGPVFVSEAWDGADAAYQGKSVEVPLAFREDTEG